MLPRDGEKDWEAKGVEGLRDAVSEDDTEIARAPIQPMLA